MPNKSTNIEIERLKRELEVKEIASLLGVSETTYHCWRNGTFKPSMRTKKRMKDAGFSKESRMDPSGYPKEKKGE